MLMLYVGKPGCGKTYQAQEYLKKFICENNFNTKICIVGCYGSEYSKFDLEEIVTFRDSIDDLQKDDIDSSDLIVIENYWPWDNDKDLEKIKNMSCRTKVLAIMQDMIDKSDELTSIATEIIFWERYGRVKKFVRNWKSSGIKVKSYNEEKYHIDNYDISYKDREDYQNAMTIGELYNILEYLLQEGRIKADEKLVVSSKGYAGFASEFDFSNKGFPIIKEQCG